MPATITKKNYKKIEIVFGVILGLMLLAFLGTYGLQKYVDWKFERDVEQLQAEEERPYLEDTYGGKTPKETLELLIAAVEKGDYDLASKYFILSKQEEWRGTLKKGVEQKKLSVLIQQTKEAVNQLKDEEPLWLSYDKYTYITKPQNVIFDFSKYPNGNWKIVEL